MTIARMGNELSDNQIKQLAEWSINYAGWIRVLSMLHRMSDAQRASMLRDLDMISRLQPGKLQDKLFRKLRVRLLTA
jgi:hypothetical protein